MLYIHMPHGNTSRSRKHHSGLDFTKAVIVANQEFINEDIAIVDQDEYKEVIYNIEKIVESVIKFVDDYVEHIKGIKSFMKENLSVDIIFHH